MGTVADRPANSTDVAGIEQQLHGLVQRILAADDGSYDPWLHGYCGELAKRDEVRRYLRYQLDHLALADVDARGARVLDAGCGFGMALVVLGLLGASKLRGIDNYKGMVDTIHAYSAHLPQAIADKLEVTYGDVCAMPYENAEFDLVLSIEAISHYLDVEAFIGEAARVLRPGGALIISDGNNLLNPAVKRKTQAIWNAFENGPAGTQVHGHSVGQSYRERRRAIIARTAPTLSDRECEQLARATAGMVETDVVAAADRYRESGAVPEPPLRRGDVPVSPEGQVMERLFDPYELARQIDAAGFRSTVHGYWGGAQGSRLVRTANALLDRAPRFTLYTAPSFRIAAMRL
jgi:SAM-dependent methyltransferase